MQPPFVNEPYVDFSQDGPRQKMQDALRLVVSELGREYPIIIAGERIRTGQPLESLNPARPSQIIGTAQRASSDLANQAVQAALDAFPAWSATDPEARARILFKAAAIVRRRIYEFSAWMVYEVSKSWAEAYADAAECVDFLEFYGREMMRMAGGHPTTPYIGEENEVRYLPMGVGAVISPWNFPLAIFAGMVTSAMVTGNTVVAKPAEQSPVVAAKFIEVLEEAGMPVGVVNFLPGFGEDVGETLTGHPQVSFVSFTGSKDVGLRIHQRTATYQPGQRWLKRAILEMGGKNGLIVDESVDLEAAADAAVLSAYGFQGQKCSACSRLIAHSAIYDSLLERVVNRAANLTMGDPVDVANYMGAVIDEEAYGKIVSHLEIGRGEGRVALNGGSISGEGWFLKPAIFADVDPHARIAQEEIFGPVLTVIRADSFDHALKIANDTEYGLTGGVFSRNRAHLERARHEFMVGNLYLNRKITGALVDVQPFGGFKLSGTDSKAGGRDYLLHFLQPKSVAERL